MTTASNVVEVMWTAWGPDSKKEFRDPGSKGQALYLNLGPGRRPLVALLTNRVSSSNLIDSPSLGSSNGERWGFKEPTFLLARKYGIADAPSTDVLDVVQQLARLRGPKTLTPEELPTLVSFVDPSRPESVIVVDPKDLETTLGPGVKWQTITIEITDDPLVSGVKQIPMEQHLPWLNTADAERFFIHARKSELIFYRSDFQK